MDFIFYFVNNCCDKIDTYRFIHINTNWFDFRNRTKKSITGAQQEYNKRKILRKIMVYLTTDMNCLKYWRNTVMSSQWMQNILLSIETRNTEYHIIHKLYKNWILQSDNFTLQRENLNGFCQLFDDVFNEIPLISLECSVNWQVVLWTFKY